jgi:hypothetical protein
MIVKNTTAQNFAINKSVQVDVNTPDVNDGYILPGQNLDLSKSMSLLDLMESSQLKEGIYSGDLVFVITGFPVEQSRSVEIYDSGSSQWATIFDEDVSRSNLHEGIALGFIYAKNCLIG